MFRRRKKKSGIIRKKYKEGDVIIEEGSEINEAYILCSGRVQVERELFNEKVVLATLKQGDIFGEMGLTDKRRRTTSVTALEDVEVDVIDMDKLEEVIISEPEKIIPIVRMLFDRIRTLNAMLSSKKEEQQTPKSGTGATKLKITIIGISPEAQNALNGDNLVIDTLPFRIGRESTGSDILSYNDLSLQDNKPYHVSRNHLMIMKTAKGIGIVDRGSTLGTIVNGEKIGGKESEKRVLLKQGENEIILGTEESPYKFVIMIEQE